METKIAERLLQINREFYGRFAKQFAETRSEPQPGFRTLLPYLPANLANVLDVGCGDGRFGRFLRQEVAFDGYTGIDFSQELLDLAALGLDGDYLVRDISEPGFLNGLRQYDLIVSLATIQHIPGRETRLAIIREMGAHLAPGGRVMLSTWQFLGSPRQAKKIRPWQEVGIDPAMVEENDYLLTWQRGGSGLRYVVYIDQTEIKWLARKADLRISKKFYSDGKEGDLNLYVVLE